jgi:hypothetical protein
MPIAAAAFFVVRSPAASSRVAPASVETAGPRGSVAAPAAIRATRVVRPLAKLHERVEAPEVSIDFATTSFDELERRYAGEGENPEWTLNARTFIQDALELPDGAAKTTFSVRCGTTVCRAIFDGHDVSALLGVGSASRAAGMSSRYQRIASDGGATYVAYFGRTPTENPIVAP